MSIFLAKEPIYLIGPTSYLPAKVMTNQDIVHWMGVKMRPEWILQRTGIETRHWVNDNEAVSDLAIHVGQNFFKKFQYDKNLIDRMLLATISGDYLSPPTAPIVQHALGLSPIGCYDVGAACAGFSTIIENAMHFVSTKKKDVLLIAADIRSKFLSKNDLGATALFGDGATCAVLTAEADKATFKVIAAELFSDGSVADIISIQAGGSRKPFSLGNFEQEDIFLKMQKGATLFVKAVQGMTESAKQFLVHLNANVEDIDWLVPHQANLLLIEEVAKRLNFPMDKTMQTVKQYGNTSGSTTGIALEHLRNNYPLKSRDKILVISAGGGGLASCVLLEAL